MGAAVLALVAVDAASVVAGLARRPAPAPRPAPVAAPAPAPIPAPAPAPAPAPLPAPRPVVAVAPVGPQVPVSTLLASPHPLATTYAAPGGAPTGTVSTWYGYPLTLPVVGRQPGWLQIRLPERPNGSTTWVQDSAMTLTSTPYFILVDLSTEHLTAYRAGYPILRFPVGIGVAATPTVTGQYFVAVRENDPGPGYGPFALDTSAHSDAIQSWDGAGDAIISIHGPIDASADALIGTTGARVSNGCIRLHDTDLAQLGMIPIGTPVEIVG